MKLEIKPEIEAGLLAQAHARGLPLEAYLNEVLEHAAHWHRGAPKSRQPEANHSVERPIWEIISGLMEDVPDEVFDRLPNDGASHVDHYIYGLPKSD